MKRVITVSLCLFAVMAFSLTSFAQDIVTSIQSEYTPQHYDGTAAVLYDQTLNGNANAYTSQEFGAANPTYTNQAADDFTATDTWTVEQVVVTGAWSLSGPADGFNIFFYENNGGIPGTEVYSEMSAPYVTNDTLFTITMVTPAVLPPGDYWVSVQCRMDFSPGGQWYWAQVDDAYGDVAQWQNPGDGFATGCTTWASIQGCIAAAGTDMYFALLGTAGSGGACALLEDHFDADIANWTPVGPSGLTNWSWVFDNQAAGADSGEMRFSWDPQFTGDSYVISPVLPSAGFINTTISFEHFVNYFGAGLTVGCATTTDGGGTWTTIWSVVDPPGNVGPENVTVPFTGDANLQIGFFYSGNSFQIDWWYIDDVCIDGIVPVELTSFTASVNEKNVTLNWSTATETNNQGFEVERNSGNGFQNIGYVAGFGTSTEAHTYSFVDASLNEGTYSYRLKQLDLDGTFEYSDVVEVDVTVPDVFALEQNYPNPFNPSTKIDFSLAVDSKVSLKVFDVLGQEVATLINTNLVAGSHNVDFNAASINSGVYFYRIEATGIDGTNFTNVKKMILTK